jgi:DNA-binding HxlR family transcriptional regulator
LVPWSPVAPMSNETTVYDENYPSRRLLNVIGDKWKPIILFVLGEGTKRYGGMQRHLPDISKKMLTQTLRALEDGGLITRKVYAEVPPKVEYDLTPLGRVFLEPVTGLCRWASKHRDDLDLFEGNHRKASARK